MRVRLWLKSTRISVATCQKERIVRRYFSLHWGAGACPAKKRGIATTKHSVSCNNTLRRFQRHGRLKRRPYKKAYIHHGNTAAKIHRHVGLKPQNTLFSWLTNLPSQR